MKSDDDPVPDRNPAEGTAAPGHPGGPRLFRATARDSCGPVTSRATARRIPADELQLRWRTFGLDLASPGRMEVISDVAALGDALVSLDLCRLYAMPVDQLIDVVLDRSAFRPSDSPVSPRLTKMAALSGVDPATLLRWHLAAGGLLPELASLARGLEP